MPLIRCDYSTEHFNDESLRKLNRAIFNTSAELCKLSGEDADNKISIFNTPFGPVDHSTASAEIEVRAKKTEFDVPGKSPSDVRAEWLRRYESVLVPLAQNIGLTAPIIFTVTLEDWEVVVITGNGSVPN